MFQKQLPLIDGTKNFDMEAIFLKITVFAIIFEDEVFRNASFRPVKQNTASPEKVSFYCLALTNLCSSISRQLLINNLRNFLS